MNEIKLTITIDEANLVLEALGNQPFVKVFELIGKIQKQAGQQLAENGLPRDPARVDSVAPTINEHTDAD